MPYHAPSQEKLQQSIMTSAYAGPHKSILTTIQSFSDVKEPNADAILAGACVHGLESIDSEYMYFSPDGSMLFKGSSLYKDLKMALKITPQNLLDDKQRLVYLTQFYVYVKNHPSTDDPSLLTHIESSIKKILTRLAPDIDRLLKRPPTHTSLSKEFKNVPQEYADMQKKKPASLLSYVGLSGPSATRNHHTALIEFVGQHISEEKPQDEYAVRCGTLLYIMQQIESEYRARSPEHSDLYKISQRILNIKHSDALLPEIQKSYLQHLQAVILKIREKKHLEKDPALLTADKNITDKIHAINHPEMNESYKDALMRTCTQLGIQFYVGEMLISLVEQEKLWHGAAALFGKALVPHYVLLALIITNFIKDRIKVNLMATVTAQANNLVLYIGAQTYKVTANSAQFIGALYTALTDQGIILEPNDDWIVALSQLPDTLFDPTKKVLLHRVFDIPEQNIDLTQEQRLRIG
jgi:hypothetical protein